LTLEKLTRIVKAKFKIEMTEETLGMQIVRLNSELLLRKLENTDEWLSVQNRQIGIQVLLYEVLQEGLALPNNIQLKIPTNTLYFGVAGADPICFKRRESPNQVWVATGGGGVSVIEDGLVTKIYDTTTGLLDNYVKALLEDAHGSIWIGRYRIGVSVIEKGKVV